MKKLASKLRRETHMKHKRLSLIVADSWLHWRNCRKLATSGEERRKFLLTHEVKIFVSQAES